MTTYYISPTGSSNGLSINNPSSYSTIYPSLIEGDELIFLPGKYRLNLLIDKQITSNNTYITYSSLRNQANTQFLETYTDISQKGVIVSKPSTIYEEAIITGCEILNQVWTNVSGFIWKTNITLPYAKGSNQIFYKDVPLVEARYPSISNLEEEIYHTSYLISIAGSINESDVNADGYLCTYSNTSLSSFPDNFWNGHSITLLPGKEWRGYIGKVISNIGSTLTFRFQWPSTSHSAQAAKPEADDLFYLWGSLDTSLLTPNSYIYDSNTQELYIYLPDNKDPNTCAIGEIEYKARLYGLEYSGVVTGTNSAIRLEGLKFFSCALRTTNDSSGLNTKYCDFNYLTLGYEGTIAGFVLRGSSGLIESCNWYVAGSNGLELRGNGHKVINNTFNKISIRPTSTHSIICYPDVLDDQGYSLFANSVWDFSAWGIECKYKRSVINYNNSNQGGVSFNRVWNGSNCLSDTSFIGSWDAGDHNGLVISFNICHDSKDRRNITSLFRLDSGGGKGCWNAVFHSNIAYNCRNFNSSMSIWGLLPSQYNGDLNIDVYNNTIWGGLTIEKGSDTTRQFTGIDIQRNILVDFVPLVSTTHTLLDNDILKASYLNNVQVDPDIGLTYCDFRPSYTSSITNTSAIAGNFSTSYKGAVVPTIVSSNLESLYQAYPFINVPFVSTGAYCVEAIHWNDIEVEQLTQYPNVVKITGLPKGRTLPPLCNLYLGSSIYLTRYETVDDDGYFTIWYVLPFSSTSQPLYLSIGGFYEGWKDTKGALINLNLSIITQPSITFTSYLEGTLTLNTKSLSLGNKTIIPLAVSALQWVNINSNPVYIQVPKSSIVGSLHNYLVKDYQDRTLNSWIDRETSTDYYLWISLVDTSIRRNNSLIDYSLYLELSNTYVPHNNVNEIFPSFGLSSFKIWLSPDSINRTGNSITSWTNKGLAGGTFNLSTPSTLDYVSTGLNSIPGASFSGDDRLLPSNMGPIDTDLYVGIVVYRNPDPGAIRNQRILSSALTGNDYSSGIYVIPDNTSGDVIAYPSGKSKLVTSSYVANPTNLTLGGNYSNTNANYKGELYELIIWDKPITPSQRNPILDNYIQPKYFNNNITLDPEPNPSLGSFNFPVYIDGVLYPGIHIVQSPITNSQSTFTLTNLPPLSEGNHSVSIKAPSGFINNFSSSYSSYDFSFNYSYQIFIMTRITNLIGTITDRWSIKSKVIKDNSTNLSFTDLSNQPTPINSKVTNNRIVIGNSNNEMVEVDPSTLFITPSSTVDGDIEGTLSTLSIKTNSVTDNKLGNRTLDQNIGTTASNTGTLTSLLSWLVKHVKSILGTTNWYDAPPTNLTTVSSHLSNTSNPHGVTGAQLGLGSISVQNSDAVTITGGSITGVTSFLSSSNPLVSGTASAGTSSLASREDHVHPVPSASSINTYLGQIAGLSPSSNSIIYFNGSSWVVDSILSHMNRVTATNIIFIDDHFICGSVASNNGWTTTSSAGSSSLINSEAGRPGLIQIFNNSGGTGSACLGTNFTNGTASVFLNTTSTTLSITSRIQTLSATGEEFEVRLGFFDSGIGSINNGAYFIADPTSNFWRCIYAIGGSSTTYTTTVALGTIWNKFTINITNGGLNTDWLINDVVVASHTVGSGLSTGVGFGTCIRKTVGTAQRYVYIDRYTLYQLP
jgi:hypothetical protein